MPRSMCSTQKAPLASCGLSGTLVPSQAHAQSRSILCPGPSASWVRTASSWRCWPAIARAINCYLACGFRQEGIRREAGLYPDGWKDFLLMGLLQSEYLSQAKTARVAGPGDARSADAQRPWALNHQDA